MSKETMGQLAIWILVIVVMVATIYFVTNAHNTLLHGLIQPDQIDPKIEEKIEQNYDIMRENILFCGSIPDDQCICKIFPDFPGSIHNEGVLVIDDLLGKIQLYNKNVVLRENEIEDAFFENVYSVKPTTDDMLYIKSIYLPNLIRIQFSSKFPTIRDFVRGIIISEYIIKDFDSLNIITYYDERLNENPGILGIRNWFRGDREKTAEQNVDSINTLIEKLPKCFPLRQEAIDEFEKIPNWINNNQIGKKTIVLPEGFSIKIENPKISLLYSGEQVKKTITTKTNSKDEIWTSESVISNVKFCSTSTNQVKYIGHGDILEISQENNLPCILIK